MDQDRAWGGVSAGGGGIMTARESSAAGAAAKGGQLQRFDSSRISGVTLSKWPNGLGRCLLARLRVLDCGDEGWRSHRFGGGHARLATEHPACAAEPQSGDSPPVRRRSPRPCGGTTVRVFEVFGGPAISLQNRDNSAGAAWEDRSVKADSKAKIENGGSQMVGIRVNPPSSILHPRLCPQVSPMKGTL